MPRVHNRGGWSDAGPINRAEHDLAMWEKRTDALLVLLSSPVRNRAVLRELRRLLAGRWQKVIKLGNSGEVHYFEHESGSVAGVKFFPKMEMV